jgi:hypothetical protein
MARGNDAPYHDGRTSPFIDATCEKFTAQGKTCDYLDIVFDATKGVEFCPTIQEGAVNGIRQITEYNAKCPDTLIVLNGYSQGAMVAGSVLSGGGAGSDFGGACFSDDVTTGLDPNSAAGKAVKAALVWGDVKHTANQPYNVLDGADKEKWPRTGANLERMNAYADVLRSYCQAGDGVCAGGNVGEQHLNYFELYTDQASSWVVEKLTPLLAEPAVSSKKAPAPASTPTPEVSSTVEIPSSKPTQTPEVSSTAVTIVTEEVEVPASKPTPTPEVPAQPSPSTLVTVAYGTPSSPADGGAPKPAATKVPNRHPAGCRPRPAM